MFSIFYVQHLTLCTLFMCAWSQECAQVQSLYRQSAEHAAEQNHLIKELEGLNKDTQKVLRNQEEAHTADTTSYQKVAFEFIHVFLN